MAQTVVVDIDQTIVLDILDELRPLIQGYLSGPDEEAQTEIVELLNSLYGYVVNRPLAHPKRKIKAGKL